MVVTLKYTPNPNSVQFFVEIQWLDFFWECKDLYTAKKSPLTESLWGLGFVTYILVGKDFIVVNKQADACWDHIIPEITEKITSFISKEKHIFPISNEVYEKILTDADLKKEKSKLSDFDKKILDVLEEKIQPGLELHGGGADFIKFENGTLFLRLTGACSGCPSSTYTIEHGIKQVMQYYFPEIESIETI